MQEYQLAYTGSEIDKRLADVEKKLSYEQQTLTKEQKEMARKNIDAMKEEDFYSSLLAALTDIEGGVRDNATSADSLSQVKVTYSDSGRAIVNLLCDIEFDAQFTVSKNIDLNLNGFTVNLVNNGFLKFEGDVFVNGGINSTSQKRGSFVKAGTFSSTTTMVQIRKVFYCKNTDFLFNIESSKSAYGINVTKDCTSFFLENCSVNIQSLSEQEGFNLRGISLNRVEEEDDFYCFIKNCDITIRANVGVAIGIVSKRKVFAKNLNIDVTVLQKGRGQFLNIDDGEFVAEKSNFSAVFENYSDGSVLGVDLFPNENNSQPILRLKDCKIRADSKNGTAINTTGIMNRSIAYLDNCDSFGTYCGIQHSGKELYINGGSYAGTRYGGLRGTVLPDGVSFINDATFYGGIYKGKFEEEWNNSNPTHYGAVTLEGSIETPKSVYCFDNCDFEGTDYAIAFMGNVNNSQNTVNLSNCSIKEGNTIHYYSKKDHLNIGCGCNITIDDISVAPNSDFVATDGLIGATNKLYRRVSHKKRLTGDDFYALLEEIDRKVNETLPIEAYFDITDDGMISLKPEYRGRSATGAASSVPYSISDMGEGVDGIRNAELPEHIVIPDHIGGIAVTHLANGMFMGNMAVKHITLPTTVKEIPRNFCRQTPNLRYVDGTENIEVINQAAFNTSGITKAIFPNLRSDGLSGNGIFRVCPMLLIADLGNKVTSIPKTAFATCDRMHTLRADSVTTVGEQGLLYTKRLKTPAFVPNLTSVGTQGFYMSRANCSWASEHNQTDWWSGCVPVECNTPLRSTFNQYDPRWESEYINNYREPLGDREMVWNAGCNLTSAAMIYSALAKKDISSPAKFVAAVGAVDPGLLDLKPTTNSTAKAYFEAVGFTVEVVDGEMTSEKLQKIYDALAAGKLVHYHITGHTIALHGINANGEVLVADPIDGQAQIGIWEAGRYAVPIQNLEYVAAYIVSKD